MNEKKETNSSPGADPQKFSVPGIADGFGERIDLVCRRFSSRTDAANAAGVSTDMLVKYAAESAMPKFGVMARFAANSGVSLDWIATGEGPLKRGFTGGQGGANAALEEGADGEKTDALGARLVEIVRRFPGFRDTAASDLVELASRLPPGDENDALLHRILDHIARRG